MRHNHSFVFSKHDRSKPFEEKHLDKRTKKSDAKKKHFLAKMKQLAK